LAGTVLHGETWSMPALSVQPLEPKSPWLTQIATSQFAYYRSRGWIDVEDVAYLGKVRTIMRLTINAAP
jgi:hypothetical protein